MKIREPDRTEERIKQSKWYGNEEVITDVGILIRCKDCRTSTLTKRINGEFLRNCPVLCMDVSDDFYCGNGRPKDGEQ